MGGKQMLGTETLWHVVQRAWLGDVEKRHDNQTAVVPCPSVVVTKQEADCLSAAVTPDRLRQRAAMAIRLAALIPGDPAAEVLQKLAVELESQAAAIKQG
jgi:hypothetical protein